MLNDVFILTQIKEGNIKAFETLFANIILASPIRRQHNGEPDVAEEIVEELFYVFWKDREKLEIFHSVKNYLYRSVRNRSIQYCEHQDVKRRYQDAILSVPVNIASPDPQEQIEYKELQQIINRTLEKLPERPFAYLPTTPHRRKKVFGNSLSPLTIGKNCRERNDPGTPDFTKRN